MIASSLPSRMIGAAVVLALANTLAGCGGSSHSNSINTISTSGTNVQPIAVNAGPANEYANGVFTSVTVCVPSTSNCQTISGILVDTGSYGLRLLSSAGEGALTLSLPQQNASGNPVGECAPFVSGYTWGPVQSADIKMTGEVASNVPVQIIDPTFAAVPSTCSSGGVPENDTLQSLGANGILGVGPFAQDCGGSCDQTGAGNPGLYYQCASTSCQVIAEPLTQQVQNPVALFATDNNGVIIELPSVSGPAASLSGSMVFGIGTESNNALGTATVFPLDANGEFSTTFKGQAYPAFVDSGSNAFFFLDETLTGLTVCPNSSGFYCPGSPAHLSATTDSGSATSNVTFTIANGETLFQNQADFVFNSLGGPNPGTFDWGLPFFFGRNVFNAIDGKSTPAGSGPFWAY
ncbi:MAG: DUF3443 domain-containing protein [Candidatus Sulfotelmatobacter sp.]